MAHRNRRGHHEDHENHERWLVSYADFITLLFAFFVVMYSVSAVNEGKMRVLSDSLSASFYDRRKSLQPIQVGKLVRSGVVREKSIRTTPLLMDLPVLPLADETETVYRPSDEGHGESTSELTEDDTGDPQREGTAMADIDTIASHVEQAMLPLIDKDLVTVNREENWVEVEINTSILYASGSADLEAAAIPVLHELAGVLKAYPNPIQVEGFTDNLPIRTAAFPSNWELSAARAASVVHLFMEAGVLPARMVAVGYGEHRPVAQNDTPQGRSRNRRVVIVIPADSNIRRVVDLQRIAEMGRTAGAVSPETTVNPNRTPSTTSSVGER